MNSAWLIPVLCVVLAAILAALFAFWRDMRKRNRKDRETTEERHVENQIRFTALETKIEPMANWFNNGRSSRGD